MAYEATVFYDQDAISPLDQEPGIRLIGFHRRYGEDHEFKSVDDLIVYAENKRAHLVRVWLYDHTAQIYSVGTRNPFADRWDSGFYGFLMFEREHLLNRGWQRLNIERRKILSEEAKGLIEQYTNWANGWRWAYQITEDGDVIDSQDYFMSEDEAQAAASARLAEYNLGKVG